MVEAAEGPLSTTDWRTKDLKQLLTIWKDLRPETDQADVERRFAGHALTAIQAGEVFERWVLEAFRLSGMVGHYGFRVPLRESGSMRE